MFRRLLDCGGLKTRASQEGVRGNAVKHFTLLVEQPKVGTLAGIRWPLLPSPRQSQANVPHERQPNLRTHRSGIVVTLRPRFLPLAMGVSPAFLRSRFLLAARLPRFVEPLFIHKSDGSKCGQQGRYISSVNALRVEHFKTFRAGSARQALVVCNHDTHHRRTHRISMLEQRL
jgi:hypothetical protein